MKLLTEERQESYENAKICYIYKERQIYYKWKHHKVSDHCHYTGEYRGIARYAILSIVYLNNFL